MTLPLGMDLEAVPGQGLAQDIAKEADRASLMELVHNTSTAQETTTKRRTALVKTETCNNALIYSSGFGRGDGDGLGSGCGYGFGFGVAGGSVYWNILGYGDGHGSGIDSGRGDGSGSGYADGAGSAYFYGSDDDDEESPEDED